MSKLLSCKEPITWIFYATPNTHKSCKIDIGMNAQTINNAIKDKREIKKIIIYKYINESLFRYITSCF